MVRDIENVVWIERPHWYIEGMFDEIAAVNSVLSRWNSYMYVL